MLQIQLVFKFFDLSKPNDCENNFVDIFSPNTEIESRVKTFCGSIAETVSSRNNVLYVRFYAEWEARNSTFSALFTAYRESKRDGDNEGKKIETEEFCNEFYFCIYIKFSYELRPATCPAFSSPERSFL
jgi:hypothetical protein